MQAWIAKHRNIIATDEQLRMLHRMAALYVRVSVAGVVEGFEELEDKKVR